MNIFSKYLLHKTSETFIDDYFEKISKKELSIKNKSLYSQINSATIKISSYFETSIKNFPFLFNANLKTFEDALIHLEKIAISNNCVCGAVIDAIPGWKCIDCSKYSNSIYCHDCYIRSKDLHQGHKVEYLYNSRGMCDCGDPDSLYTYCHEHSGPFTEQKQIDDYMEKSFGKNILENLKKFFDKFFLEFSKYLILTEKCELFIEEFFENKFKGNLSEDLNNEKNDVVYIKSNFKVVFENFIYFLRLITKNNLGMVHLISNYFLKNNLDSLKLEEEYMTNHRCIEIKSNDIKIYFDGEQKENHFCKCPFFRHYLSNYRNNIELKLENDEKKFIYSFVHNSSSRSAYIILYFFLLEQILNNNNLTVINCRTQFFLEDALELIANKTSFIEDSADIFYKYILKIMKSEENFEHGMLTHEAIKSIYHLIFHFNINLKKYSKPKIRFLISEKISFFKRIIDLICLFQNIYEYKSVVPHPEFQDKPFNKLIYGIEEHLTNIASLMTVSFDWTKIPKLKEIYKYIIFKILNQEKEGIKQLQDNEFSYYLVLYRSFEIFMNAFCFNYSFNNNCTLLESINFFKKNFFESQEQIEDFVNIILKDYFKFFGFIYGTKNNFFNYYDNADQYYSIYTIVNSYENDIALIKYLFILTEKEININTYLKLSNIEDVYKKFDLIFNKGKTFDLKLINEQSDEKKENDFTINLDNIINSNFSQLSDEEKDRFLVRLVINEKLKQTDKKKDEFNIIMQWESLLQFLIFILRDDSSCYSSLFNFYNDITSLKTKLDLFNTIKTNKYVMEDLKNILQEKLIMNIISQGNLIDMGNLEKKLDDYLLFLLNDNDEYNQILDKLTYNKMKGETKMFYLKDEYLKYIDCNYFLNLKDKSKTQKYILDFKKDVIKTYNYHFYNQSELTFEFFLKLYEKVFLSKDNLELIIKMFNIMLNNDNISEYLDKNSMRNSLLPIMLNYLQIFNVINTKSFIEFKIENKESINKLYELLYNFIKNNEKNNFIDKDLEDNMKEVINQMNRYQLIYDIYEGDLSKLNINDLNVNILEQLKQNQNLNSNNINIIHSETNINDIKKQKNQNMKEKIKLKMKKISNIFLQKIESNEDILKAIDEHINDIENMKNKNDEIMCFYCRNSINLTSFEVPYGKLGIYIKDLFYINSIKATLRDEFSKLKIKDEDNKIYSQAMKMIYNQGYYRVISCGHYFHNSCFVEGSKKSENEGFSCPLCLKSENILIPPLTLFHDKYKFLQSKKFSELFGEDINNDKKDEIKENKDEIEGINLFNSTVMNYLMTLNFFKNEIKKYVSFLDNIHPYYKAYLNYFENVFYADGSTFHKQQQIDNIKNLILSLRLVLNDTKDFDKFEIIKFIKESLLSLAKGPDENRFIYKYHDSYMHYLNIFEKIMLSLQLLFDYEEIKDSFKYLIYVFLPYFCFGLYFKSLILEKQNNNINEEQFKQKLNIDEFHNYLKNDNKQIMNSFQSFLQKFCLIKLISDYQNKNEDIINRFNELSIKNILPLIDMDELLKNLPADEFLITDIINSLPKTFNKSEIFSTLFSSVLNFDKTILSIFDNIKKYNNTLNTNIPISHELLIQFSPIKFNFYPLENNIFDFIEKNTTKICNTCGKIHKGLFYCLICGQKICKNNGLGINSLLSHNNKCTGSYGIYFEITKMNIYVLTNEKLYKLSPIYVNKTGTGPKGKDISNEYNLNKEKVKLAIRNYISNDFYSKE